AVPSPLLRLRDTTRSMPAPFRIILFPLTTPTHTYTLSLHDALPILSGLDLQSFSYGGVTFWSLSLNTATFVLLSLLIPPTRRERSEEHTSELQSREKLVCRLLLEKKNQVRSYEAVGHERVTEQPHQG